MSILDVNRIINGTPQKVFNNAYTKMKDNYTKENAEEFFNTYRDQNMSFILENSRSIFSEPYYGCSFYKEAMNNNFNCNFTKFEAEFEKVQSYIEDNLGIMSENQASIYKDLDENFKSLMEHTKNTRIIANYISERVDDQFEEKLSNAISSVDSSDEIISAFESCDKPSVFFAYAPYVIDKIDPIKAYNLTDKMCIEASIDNDCTSDQWKTYIESVICENKLSNDYSYNAAVQSIINPSIKLIFEYFMNSSISNIMDELVTERAKNEVIYDSPKLAINNIYFDISESVLDNENNKIKERIESFKKIAYESTLDILSTEYQYCDNLNENAEGYSILNEESSIEDAMMHLNSIITESEYDDIKDFEDSSVEDRISGNEVSSRKKPVAPKPKNLANKIQFNAMDKEAKWQQKQSIRAQKGQEIVNAAKSVLAIPSHILDNIKDTAHKLDEMDDERRKKYMVEPGFRKKMFRNLRLAILYGSTATVNLAMVPTVMMCRHFSKQKDRRIRNELERQLLTDIKVCEEKIADANGAGDQKEKYRLIRIKDKLDAEVARVKYNSKYI